MTNELLEAPRRRHVQELNLVPIIDMLTTIIFFLLLSMSFIQYSKLSVPDSSISVVSGKDKLPELQPKLLLVTKDANTDLLVLKWSGEKGGELSAEVKGGELELEGKVREFLTQFKDKNPNEKVLQVALSSSVPYAKLIQVMDSSREFMPDVVLLSAKDAERLTASTEGDEK